MNRDLFLSILAMDSYNRGYGAGLTNLDETGSIGKATISPFKGQQVGWKDAGFYAIAYDMTDVSGFGVGEKAISYRGTDDLSSDAAYGYPLALGNVDAQQGILANSFYHDVTGAFIGQTAANVTLTGHSLGGGLAGYVGAVSGVKNVVFDHMPFGIAAEFKAKNVGVTSVRFDLTSAIHTEDEFLIYARNGTYQAVSSFVGAAVAGLFGAGFGAVAAYDTRRTEALIPAPNELQDFRDGFHPSDNHSIALLVSLLYAKQAGISADWQSAANQLWDAFFNENVAAALGQKLEERRGVLSNGDTEKAGNVLRSAIAYSAIDEGERPFGDTGIRAMFDDAGDLGKAIQAEGATGRISALAPQIAKSLVEYAGALALNDVEANPPVEGITRDPDYIAKAQASVSGIISSPDGSNALSLDYTADSWSFANGGSTPTIAGRAELLEKLLPTIPVQSSPKAIGTVPDSLFAGTPSYATIIQAMQSLWHIGSTDTFDRVSLAINGSGATVTIGESASFQKAGLFVGAEGADTVTGSTGANTDGFGNDLLIGNGGDDVLDGRGGDDIIYGGAGNDILSGGLGDDRLFGGAGNDVLTGFGGADVLSGGEGSDRYVIKYIHPFATLPRTSYGEEDLTDCITVEDDTGVLEFSGTTIGSDSSAPGGTLQSGIALAMGIDNYWSIGPLILHKVGSDLEISMNDFFVLQKNILILKDFENGDYGFTLEPSDLTTILVPIASNITDREVVYNVFNPQNGSSKYYVGWLGDLDTYQYNSSNTFETGFFKGSDVFGTNYDDVISASYGSIVNEISLFGYDGNDEIYVGHNLRDTLDFIRTYTTYGDLISHESSLYNVYGGNGRDNIYMGDGLITAHGDSGDDSFYSQWLGASDLSDNTVYGDEGNDRFFGPMFSKIDGGSGDDVWIIDDALYLSIDDKSGISTASFWNWHNADPIIKSIVHKSIERFEISARTIGSIETGNGDDVVAVTEADGGFIDTSGGNDTIRVYGGENKTGNVVIYSGDGDDHIFALSSFTNNGIMVGVEAGSGDDYVESMYSGVIHGGAGDDVLVLRGFHVDPYPNFPDAIWNFDPVAELFGDGGNDIILSAAGNNWLSGGEGDDILDGGDGNDGARYAGAWRDYAVSISGIGVVTVQDLAGTEGQDTLSHIELLSFSNGVFGVEDTINFAPQAVGDEGTASEIGNPVTGNVLENDSDPNLATSGLGEVLKVGRVGSANETPTEVDGSADVKGRYGTLTITQDGVYRYLIANPPSVASAKPVSDVFYYTVVDAHGLSSNATLTIHIAPSLALPQPDDHGAVHLPDDFKVADYSAFSAPLTIYGGASENQIIGTTFDDRILGNGGNDEIQGGAGADRMEGGDGDDTYYVDNVGDVVKESWGNGLGGTDTVFSSVSIVLPKDVENVTLTGSANIDAVGTQISHGVLTGNGGNNKLSGGALWDTISGGDGDDQLYGRGGADALYGGTGNDLLDGGTGADYMEGGTGNDAYYVDSSGDVVREYWQDGNGGFDTVYSTISYIAPANVEAIKLQGTANIDATARYNEFSLLVGNDGANTLTGGDFGDILYGRDGDDVLIGGLGKDKLTGGSGADRFVFASVADLRGGTDEILDFSRAEGDRVVFSGIDLDPLQAGRQKFAFIGDQAFTAGGDYQLRATDGGNGDFSLEGDLDRDGLSDFAVRVHATSFGAMDLVL